MNSPKLKALSKAYSKFYRLTIAMSLVYDIYKKCTATDLHSHHLPTDNCCESCLRWIQKCTSIILRLFTKAGFQYLLCGTYWQAICLQASHHFYKKFSHEFQKWKLSYVNYRFCVNQSSLKYLNLFQENWSYGYLWVADISNLVANIFLLTRVLMFLISKFIPRLSIPVQTFIIVLITSITWPFVSNWHYYPPFWQKRIDPHIFHKDQLAALPIFR